MEIILNGIFWCIFITGSLAIVWGCIYCSWLILGRIIKLLGYWPMFMKALRKVAEERYKNK